MAAPFRKLLGIGQVTLLQGKEGFIRPEFAAHGLLLTAGVGVGGVAARDQWLAGSAVFVVCAGGRIAVAVAVRHSSRG